jgi:hypothetical protein
MSWRRFATLLRGLGPLSGVVQRTHLRALRKRDEPREISDPAEINAAFQTLFGNRRSTRRRREQKH